MNFTNNSAPKASSYPHTQPQPHRSSYYATNNNGTKYSRSQFNSPVTPYHPRLINTPLSATHNHIKKNYHFSAKSSELFIKKKELNNNNNNNPMSQPNGTGQTVQLLTTLSGTSTISFSSQHTPQSFIANKTKLKSKTKAKTRWKRDRERSRERHKHSTWRRHREDSDSRSRSRSRSKKQFESESDSPSSSSSSSSIATQSNDIDMSQSHSDGDRDVDINIKYTLQSNDIYCFYKTKHVPRRNYAKQEILRKMKVKSHRWSMKERRNPTQNETENEIYNQDLNNSDCAIYEMPFKKPKFMRKMKEFVSSHTVPPSVIRRINKINTNLFMVRNKKRKQRETYIATERSQSAHWNSPPSKCWFYRCVHMLEGHVLTMCSSPQFCGGVSDPKKLLDEIEKQLARIHPLPPLIYQRLFKTLGNLANLIKTYPNAVQWDSDKLQSVFEKAIRKQQQMKTIYNFKADANQFIEYDFAPFKLPQMETHNITFHLTCCTPHDPEMEEDDGDETDGDDDEAQSTHVLSLNSSAHLSQLSHNPQRQDNENNTDDLRMETPFDLNMDLVRKTNVTLNPAACNATTFVISPKIEKLVTANCAKINELKSKKKSIAIAKTMRNEGKKKEIKSKEKEWAIERVDSNDERTDAWLKSKKERLKRVLRNNGVHGPIKAMGLQPTHDELPILYELPSSYRNLNDKRVPSIYYMISRYIDDSNPWYIRLLLKYFDCAHPTFTCKQVRNYISKHPKCIKRTFMGTTSAMTIAVEMYIEMESIEYYMRFTLNEAKRHKLLCALLRLKNKQERKRRNGMSIPQPPPPHNVICVNFNWNGFCDTTFCNKKHECSCCGDKHPARICRKQCVDYNWAKCHRICPKNKLHSCSQCRDSKHPAWRCPYLHKSVTERYYAIYKTKKIRNGYFRLMERKEQKKNIEWINRKKLNPHPVHVSTIQNHHSRHHHQKTKKRKHV